MKLTQMITKGFCAAAVLTMLVGQSQAAPLYRPNVVTIYGDRGGEVIRYALRAKKMAKRGQQVRFSGRCDSACTIYLSMPKRLTCVSRNAKFGFHLPYGAGPRGNTMAANYLMRSYPGWVKRWIAAKGGLSRQIKIMDYAYAKRYLPPCGGRSRVNT